MKARSAAWFTREIKKAVETNSYPVRFCVEGEEIDLIYTAIKKAQVDAWHEIEDGAKLRITIMDPQLKPIKVLECKDNQEWLTKKEKLGAQYEDTHCLETIINPPTDPVCYALIQVWNPYDYMKAGSMVHMSGTAIIQQVDKKRRDTQGRRDAVKIEGKHRQQDAKSFGFTCSDCESDYREHIGKGKTPAQARNAIGIKRGLKGDKLTAFKERLRQYATYHKW